MFGIIGKVEGKAKEFTLEENSPITESFLKNNICNYATLIPPPAFSIAAFAPADTASAVIVSADLIAQRPRILRSFPFSRIIRFS